jgi:pyruvate dehydrogenase E2 component (dihydrolipoamide acetyltransferase)
MPPVTSSRHSPGPFARGAAEEPRLMRLSTSLRALVPAGLLAAALSAPALAEPPMPSAPPAPAAAPAAAPAPPAPAPAPAPARPAPATDPLMAGGLRLLLGSLGVVALVLVAGRLVRRLPVSRLLGVAGNGPIRVTASAPLGGKARVCLLEVAGTSVLVAVGPQGVQPLHAWPQAVAAPAPRPVAEGRAADTPATPGQLEGLASRLRGGAR